MILTEKLVLKLYYFSALASKLNTGLINKGWYGMFFACGIWCVAYMYMYTIYYPTGEKHTISTFVDQTRIIILTIKRLYTLEWPSQIF